MKVLTEGKSAALVLGALESEAGGLSGRVWQAVRAPLVLTAIAWAITREPVLRAVVTVQSEPNLVHRFLCAPLHSFFRLTPMQHDCFMYLPVSLWSIQHRAWLAGYFAALIVGLSVAALLRQDSASTRLGWKTWLGTAILAAWPWLLVLEGPRGRLLPVWIVLTGLTWCFIGANVAAAASPGALTRRTWLGRLARWTFPIADVAWFGFHQRRMGQGAGWLRFVPAVFALVALAALALPPWVAVRRAAPPDPLPVRVFDPHQVSCDAGGCWFAETVGHAAGLWRYDVRSRRAVSVVRAQDLRSFVVGGPWLYLYDGFESELLKVDGTTGRAAWRVPVPRADAVDVVGDGTMVFAVTFGGTVTGVDPEGGVRVRRALGSRAWYPQALGGGRVAFVSPDAMEVRVVGGEPAQDAAIRLPISAARHPRPAASAEMPLVVGTAYADRSQTLYVATLWGEILRYAFADRQWRPSIRRPPGIRSLAVDEAADRLFVYHHVGGYIDLLELDSGRPIERVMAPVFGNALSASPAVGVAVLSARGPGNASLPQFGGLYELRYARRVTSTVSSHRRPTAGRGSS